MPVIVPNYAEPPHASPASPPDFSFKCQSERLSRNMPRPLRRHVARRVDIAPRASRARAHRSGEV
jgi:hypothetical protein